MLAALFFFLFSQASHTALIAAFISGIVTESGPLAGFWITTGLGGSIPSLRSISSKAFNRNTSGGGPSYPVHTPLATAKSQTIPILADGLPGPSFFSGLEYIR